MSTLKYVWVVEEQNSGVFKVFLNEDSAIIFFNSGQFKHPFITKCRLEN